MALKSFRITKKELTTYYDPKTTEYEYMVNSINSPMGFGQVIQSYTGNGAEVLNTYYHIYDNNIGAGIIYDVTNGITNLPGDAGPAFWGVSSSDGEDFVSGQISLPGLRKLLYCNGCPDGNGLNKPVIENFKQRFRQVNEMVLTYNLLEGFLFYDLALPKYQNVFPAVKVDDGVNVDYKFKNVNTGADLTPTDVSVITQKPISEIETSVDDAPIIKPQEGANTVITSCCDEKVSFVISGQYQVGSILYTTELTESYCWYVESLTKEEPTVSATFTSGGRSCKQCVYDYGCPSGCEEIFLVMYLEPSDICTAQLPFNSYAVNFTDSVLRVYGSGSSGDLDCGNLPSAPIGYYSDQKFIWFWNGDNLIEYGICGGGSNTIIEECCSGKQHVVQGTYPNGMVLYTKDWDPATCFSVVGDTGDEANLFVQLSEYKSVDCKECTNNYPGGCK